MYQTVVSHCAERIGKYVPRAVRRVDDDQNWQLHSALFYDFSTQVFYIINELTLHSRALHPSHSMPPLPYQIQPYCCILSVAACTPGAAV
jgi:hypothetical protein